MARLSDNELVTSLHGRRADACYVPHQPFARAKANDCHENARKYTDEHPGCTLIQGWLIGQFVGLNYFVAHTVIELPDGSWIDPTPMRVQHPFLRHLGSGEDFEEQRRNRAQVQFVQGNVNHEELLSLLSQVDLPMGDSNDMGEDMI